MNLVQKTVVAGFALFFLNSCSTNPQPFNYGKDMCNNCKMTIMDPKFGAEIITNKGKVYKFDDLRCIIHFLKSGNISENDIKKSLVINYEKQNDFIDTKQAIYLESPALQSPMGSNAAGFISKSNAQKKIVDSTYRILNWDELYSEIK